MLEDKYIGLNDCDGNKIFVRSTLHNGKDKFEICFGHYVGDSYGDDVNYYGLYMIDMEGSKYPIHIDLISKCKVDSINE